jgi:hypothetical protein
MKIMAVLLCSDSIKNEALKRVQRITQSHGIMLKKIGIQLEDVTSSNSIYDEISRGHLDFVEKR